MSTFFSNLTHRRATKRGFTLLELIVVIVVLGILAAIAIPTFSGVIDRSNRSAAKTTAQSFVSEAKTIYSQDHNGAQGIDKASLEAAAADTPSAVPNSTLPGETSFVITHGSQTATIDATTGAITLSGGGGGGAVTTAPFTMTSLSLVLGTDGEYLGGTGASQGSPPSYPGVGTTLTNIANVFTISPTLPAGITWAGTLGYGGFNVDPTDHTYSTVAASPETTYTVTETGVGPTYTQTFTLEVKQLGPITGFSATTDGSNNVTLTWNYDPSVFDAQSSPNGGNILAEAVVENSYGPGDFSQPSWFDPGLTTVTPGTTFQPNSTCNGLTCSETIYMDPTVYTPGSTIKIGFTYWPTPLYAGGQRPPLSAPDASGTPGFVVSGWQFLTL